MQEEFSLNDDRRVRTLSPGALTARRFFRNRLAVVGLVILAAMFLFSFVGGALIPYGQDQVFYRDELQRKEFAGVSRNTQFRFRAAPGQTLDAVLQARFTLAQSKGQQSFTIGDSTYDFVREGQDLYSLWAGETMVGIAHKDLVDTQRDSFAFVFQALKAYTTQRDRFTAEDSTYTLDEHGTVTFNAQPVAYISRLALQSRVDSTDIPRELRETILLAVEENAESFAYGDREFSVCYDGAAGLWSVREAVHTRVWDSYAAPSRAHPLGTDKNGMDMLTRLMYGGRVSLLIGFIVVLIAAALGVLFGGVSGYFGGWVDNLVMRIVDIFYCIPSTPLLIILGAAMDAMRMDPQLRMLLLMLILGFLGWPGIARLVRGQILSLREQEFMTATEAAGLRVRRRIFRHLIPNVIPQLIVTCTMSLGSTILTEATLSFLGLGVKFPFASWGNIMNDVANAHVLTSYWFVWIPAGICLMLAVLGFNFAGDGLRDAFDPKMKR